MRARGEGTVTQRKDGLWQAGWTKADGSRHWFYGRTQREALDKMRADQAQNAPVDAHKQTVEHFLRRWLEDTARTTLRPSSYGRYAHQFTAFAIPAFGRKRLRDLSPQDIQSLYAARLKAGAAPATVHLLHAALHRAFKDAVRWRLVPFNPCDLVDAPRPKSRTQLTTLSLEEARRFLACAVDDKHHALWVLALTTGMRRGELLALRWTDIDFGAGVVRVQRTLSTTADGYVETDTKTERGRRRIELLPMAVEALQLHRDRQIPPVAHVFPPGRGGVGQQTWVFGHCFHELLKRAGCPIIRFHDLRHSCATLLLSLNVHPRIVQEVLGHSTISMTIDTYSHHVAGMQRQAMDDLGRILGP